ncbi:hypothetical protein ACIPID_18400, partial [Cupriavidus sp. CER94]
MTDLLPALPDARDALPNALASPVLPAGQTDAQLVRTWLDTKYAAGLGIRASTRAQYALEAHRLLLYAHALGRPLASWQVADANGYLAFLADPPTHAVGDGRARQDSPAWRPLRGPPRCGTPISTPPGATPMKRWRMSHGRWPAGCHRATGRLERIGGSR